MITFAQIEWINKNLEIEVYLNELGVDIPPNGKVFCPFHHNVNTPAAKVFYRDDGNTVYCFACKRHFGVYDVMKRAGYSDGDIRSQVPKEYWYSAVDEKPAEQVKIPDTSGVDKLLFAGNMFGYLKELDYLWENSDKVKCISLR